MKIIAVDNYDRQGPGYDDRLVAENVSKPMADRIVTLLNGSLNEHSEEFFRAVDDDYKLQEFEP